eukprot:SAG31_NODE_23495_length_503_cov_0.888614_1_plen_41_part_10
MGTSIRAARALFLKKIKILFCGRMTKIKGGFSKGGRIKGMT